MTTREASTTRAGTDPVSKLLLKLKIPRTRENWIKMQHMGSPPADWGVEHEMELPADLRQKVHRD